MAPSATYLGGTTWDSQEARSTTRTGCVTLQQSMDLSSMSAGSLISLAARADRSGMIPRRHVAFLDLASHSSRSCSRWKSTCHPTYPWDAGNPGQKSTLGTWMMPARALVTTPASAIEDAAKRPWPGSQRLVAQQVTILDWTQPSLGRRLPHYLHHPPQGISHPAISLGSR